MLKIVFQNAPNVIFAIFLKKLLFRKIIIYFINNVLVI